MPFVDSFREACFRYVMIIAAMYAGSNWLAPLFFKEKGTVPDLLPTHMFAITSLAMIVTMTISTYYLQQDN